MAADAISERIEARRCAVEAVLQNGRPLKIRAIWPGDKARLLQHFAGLSAKTRYFRFFGYKRDLTDHDLARFTELDFTQHVGISATLHESGRERFIGVARCIRKETPSRAEIALAVLDQYQGQGIGPLLLRHLARIAHDKRNTQFEADVRGDNSRMIAVLATAHKERLFMADFYLKDATKHRQMLRHLKPETAQAYANFSETVFKDAAVSRNVKNLIAIEVAHVTQCPWCIDGHVQGTKRLSATDEEIAEAIYVAAEMRAGAALRHAGIAMAASETFDAVGDKRYRHNMDAFENGEPERLLQFDPADAPFHHSGKPGSILDVLFGPRRAPEARLRWQLRLCDLPYNR